MGRLFISYRRDDTQDITGRLYDRLAAHFGKANIFMDVDSLQLGSDFRKILFDAVNSSDVALVIIGRQWLTIADGDGVRRIDNPSDFVRIEVEAAISRDIPVVPILTQGVSMPHENDLPPPISQLTYRHGFDVRSDNHFSDDVDQLILRLEPLMTPTHMATPLSNEPVADVFERLTGLGFQSASSSGVHVITPPLVTVSAGAFLMGSDKNRDTLAQDNELPPHRIEIAEFQIAKYPVTVAEYVLAVRAGAVREPPMDAWKHITWTKQLQHLDHPVVNVSLEDVNHYLAWLMTATGQPGWRLPTEAEWEKAARWDPLTHRSLIYPWGDSFDKERCNTSESRIGTTVSVGSYPASDIYRSGASALGAEEMIGNIWEWTSSVYLPYPYILNSVNEEQKSSNTGVLRGGSWDSDASDARTAFRYSFRQDDIDSDLGFRLVFAPQSK